MIKKTIQVLALAYFFACASLHAQTGAFLGDLTWPEAKERLETAPLVIIPFGGGAKEHGPHLPMNADSAVMEYL